MHPDDLPLEEMAPRRVLFSAFSPHSPEELISPPPLLKTAYHLVGAYDVPLLARFNPAKLLIHYLTMSRTSQTLIDVTLPYSDEPHSRAYLGRYLIHRGQLIGIRMHTNARSLSPAYSNWPRYKVKTVRFHLKGWQQPANDIKVGQFILGLNNARFGLLFGGELAYCCNEYSNYGLDVVAVVHDTEQGQYLNQKWVSQLTSSSIGIVANMGSIDALVGEDEIREWLSNGHDTVKNFIAVRECDLQALYLNKQYHQLGQRNEAKIQAFQVDCTLTNCSEFLPLVSASLMDKYKIVTEPCQAKHAMDKDTLKIGRLIYHLGVAAKGKVAVVLQNSHQTVALIYLLDSLARELQIDSDILNQHITWISSYQENDIIHLVEEKFSVSINHQQQVRNEESSTIHIIEAFESLVSSYPKQQLFPILSESPQVYQIINLLHQRLEQQGSINQLQNAGKYRRTFVQISVSCVVDLAKLYLSKDVRNFVTDDQLYDKLSLKISRKEFQKPKQQPHTHNKQSISLFQLLHQKCFDLRVRGASQHSDSLLHEFQQLMLTQTLDQQAYCMMFKQFILRKASSLHLADLPSIKTFLQITTLQPSIFLEYYLLNCRHQPTALQSLTENQRLIQIKHIRQTSRSKCHLCRCHYPVHLTYQCDYEPCQQVYCEQCLLDLGFTNEKRLSDQRRMNQTRGMNGIERCPKCMSTCKQGCNTCEQVNQSSGKEANQDEQRCHYCEKVIFSQHLRCSVEFCRLMFCQVCLDGPLKELRAKKSHECGWKCLVCLNLCTCNTCQAQKSNYQHSQRIKNTVSVVIKNGVKSQDDQIKQKSIELVHQPLRVKSQTPSREDYDKAFRESLPIVTRVDDWRRKTRAKIAKKSSKNSQQVNKEMKESALSHSKNSSIKQCKSVKHEVVSTKTEKSQSNKIKPTRSPSISY